jgi:UV DNA damage endonuclease
MLSLLKLPPQQDRDAVIILHLGGVFGDKAATLDRFRQNYAKLSPSVKRRLVLENDDVSWSVHDLLPLCQELDIPLVLDFHHHNIVFDSTKVREGTKDIVQLFPAIIETWKRKGITPKMHYSEPCPDAVTARARRKHSPRVMTLPPCPNDMDLMIEAKDKEQAVFELMRTFKLPGFDLFNDIVQHVRRDENKPFKPKTKPKAKKSSGKNKASNELEDLDIEVEGVGREGKAPAVIPEEEVNMGGPLRQVYWPPGMEHWLRPPKRVVKKKEETVTVQVKKKRKITIIGEEDVLEDGINDEDLTVPATKKTSTKKTVGPKEKKKKVAARAAPTPSPSDDDNDTSPLSDVDDEEGSSIVEDRRPPSSPTRTRSGRAARVSYKEEDVD